jgi:signal transduction histidine kinase
VSTLRRQLLWASFGVSLPPLAVLAAVSLVVASRQIEMGLQERSLAGARGAAIALETALDALRSRAMLVATDPALVAAVVARRPRAALGLAERAVDVIGVDRTTIVDVDRRVLARGHLPAQYGDVWAETPLDITRAEANVLRGGVGMFVALPITDSTRGVVGALVAQKALDYATLRQLKRQFGLDFSVWTGDHLQATTLRSPVDLAAADRTRRDPACDAACAAGTHYFARARLEGAELGTGAVVVALDTSAAATLKARLVSLYLGVALALVGLSVAGAYLAARRIAGPVRRLAQIADAAAQGSIEPAAVPLEGPREIRELAERFGNMLVKRREAEDELRLVQAELERRVTARTEELRQSEEHLRQARQLEALGRLAGGVAHDFNNVLTTITGNAELLIQDLGAISAPDQIQEEAREIRHSAAHAAGIVRQLMAFSRQQATAAVVLDLGRVVLDLDKMLRRLCTADVHLSVTAEPDLRPISADPTQIGQVLVNLVVNAQDALPNGGSVRVRVSSIDVQAPSRAGASAPTAGRYTCLEVADDGLGMDPETARRIFEPFYTTKAPGKGTGMGLATVHGIVKQCGAQLDVDTRLGHGTTFRIYFPAVAEAVPAPAAPRDQPVPTGREAILLCEDEPSVRTLSAGFLRSGGYEVFEAGSGARAIELAAEQPDIALLVTDVVMPVMNGVQLARLLREQRPELRVVYLSGYTASVLDHRSDSSLKDMLLTKPFTRAELLVRVRRALDAPQEEGGLGVDVHEHHSRDEPE